MFILIPFIARVLLESFILVWFNLKGNLKGSETKPYLRERILEGAYFNKGVCHVNHNSLQFSTCTRILVCTIMRPVVTVPHIDWF